MREYTQQEQTEIVRDAMMLTTAIQIDQEELRRLQSERFRNKPARPVRTVLDIPTVQPQIPAPPKSQLRYTDYLKANKKRVILFCMAAVVLAVLISILMKSFFFMTTFLVPAFWIALIVSVVCYVKKRSESNQQLAQSPEYLAAVEEAKRAAAEQQQKAQEETAKQQAELDANYQAEQEQYDTVTLPAYQQALAEWKKRQAEKIAILQEDLQVNSETLENLYETTKLVSLAYRELWILRWLYDDMRSSDHDIRFAMELLDRDRQRTATEQSGRMVQEAVGDLHSSMMSGFQAVYAAVEEGNEELVKTRRHQNISNAVGIAQRYQLNKAVKAQNAMLEKHFDK